MLNQMRQSLVELFPRVLGLHADLQASICLLLAHLDRRQMITKIKINELGFVPYGSKDYYQAPGFGSQGEGRSRCRAGLQRQILGSL